MSQPLLKSIMPRSLYGRAALILFVPVVTILLVLSVAFIQRHYEGVTRQMTASFARTVTYLSDQTDAAPDLETAARRASELGATFGLDATILPALPASLTFDPIPFYDLNSRLVLRQFDDLLDGMLASGMLGNDISLWLEGAHGVLVLRFHTSQASARNPHQLLVVVAVSALLMTLIAGVFLKNQMRPIRRLAAAAEAFGRGQAVPYWPAGATEVRAAGKAFLEMRRRIEHHIEQRTLMLSGVSHDLRTPLTRMRLELAMLDDQPEARALLADLQEMEALIDRFLEFARADVAEESQLVPLRALVCERIAEGRRAGQNVALATGDQTDPGALTLRPQLFSRALDNLLGNAARYGSRAEVRIEADALHISVIVEDNGPGIAPERIEDSQKPFVRLDDARGANNGGGAGLGLAIAADAMRSHGGVLKLGRGSTPGLGGLEARLVLPRTPAGAA